MSVKRYDHSEIGAHYFGEDDSGQYVRYEDYVVLNEQNSKLWNMIIPVASELGIDTKNQLVTNDKPSEVFVSRIEALKEEGDALKAELAERQKYILSLEDRVSELETLVRDIRQHDINETTKRISDGGRKFNYSLPLNIRERIASALKEPANEG